MSQEVTPSQRRSLEMIANGTPAMFHSGGKDRSCCLCAAHISVAREALGWEPTPSEGGRTNVGRSVSAVLDVIAERERQRLVEGWTPEHDDEHKDTSLALAAVSYAHPDPLMTSRFLHKSEGGPKLVGVPLDWPLSWSPAWWTPKDRRRDLVRAAALILAEIERLDRAAQPL